MVVNTRTIRGDGEIIAEVNVGDRTVAEADQTWATGEVKRVRLTSAGGDWHTIDQTLREALHELVGFEDGDRIFKQVKNFAVVTICAEDR